MATNHHLLQIVHDTFPNFDATLPSDRIKAEKLLKARQKLDPSISNDSIDLFFSDLNKSFTYYEGYEKDKNLTRIIKGEYFDINSKEMYVIYASDEELQAFGTHHASEINDYIRKNIQNNNWSNLREFYKYYKKLWSYDTEDFIKQAIKDRNQILLPIFEDYTRYGEIVQHIYPLIPDYYQLQSDLNPIFFEDDINDINNQVANYQNTENKNKAILGQVLVALSNFETEDPELKMLLEKNGKIGAKWRKLDSNVSNYSKTLNKQSKQTDIKEDVEVSKRTDWFLIVVYLLVVAFISYKLTGWFGSKMWYVLGAELFFYAIFYKSLMKRYLDSASSNERNARTVLKKICYTSLLLQLYLLLIAVFLALIAAALAFIFFTKGFGIIVLVLIYRAIRKK